MKFLFFLGGDHFIGDNSNYKEQSVDVWTIVAPVLALILFIFLIILVCILRKRRQNIKQPLEQGAVMTPLMSGFEMNNAQVVAAGGQATHPHQNGGNAGELRNTLPVQNSCERNLGQYLLVKCPFKYRKKMKMVEATSMILTKSYTLNINHFSGNTFE